MKSLFVRPWMICLMAILCGSILITAVPTARGDSPSADTYTASADTYNIMYFVGWHVVSDYTASLQVTNQSTAPVQVSYWVRAAGGAILSSAYNVSIAPGTPLKLDPAKFPAGAAWVQLVTNVVQVTGQVVLSSPGKASVIIPVLTPAMASLHLGFKVFPQETFPVLMVVNPNSASAIPSLVALNAKGDELGRHALTALNSGECRVVGLAETLGANILGQAAYVRIDSDLNVAGLELAYLGGAVVWHAVDPTTPMPKKAAAPVFTPGPGTYSSAQLVTVASSTGGTITLTGDGTDPVPGSMAYPGPFYVHTTVTLKARTFQAGLDPSDVTTAVYTITTPSPTPTPTPQKVAAPVFSPPGGSYTSAQMVSLTSATQGATIAFTTNGSDPTSSSTIYSGPFKLTGNATIKARAYKSGMNMSDITTAVYVITIPQAKTAAPVFSPPGGSYTSAQMVTLSCATPGATITFTTNGTDPTTASPVYTSPIKLSGNATIKARAFKSGMNPSDIVTAVYTITISPK
ncbi:MAG: chitobiase/beta-hexosaminidase C-terminal domain-containing protein [Deltaproteobacteria bacterium]|nr:chitobiase/beta-hexosaminidase C-terminal domain-containing protein [Deltaproteobacteria bacterium]